MNRNSLIQQARKILVQQQRHNALPPWINLCGNNPAPDDYGGPIINFTVRPKVDKERKHVSIYTET